MLTVKVHNTGKMGGQFYMYDADVYVNEELIATARNIPHHRPSGWRPLVRKVSLLGIGVDDGEQNG